MKVLLTGGGTGGHIYPALALAEHFLAHGDEVAYIGLDGGLEERLVPAAGVRFLPIPAAPLQRKISVDVVRTFAKNAAGIRVAARHVATFAPDAVIATGGYVSFPTIFAAWLYGRGRPRNARAFLGLLEPNAVAGLTNRILAPFVDEIWGSFPQSAGRFADRFITTGVPVRTAFARPPSRVAAAAELGLDADRRTILVIGGSQGARSLNRALEALFARGLPPDRQIIHITGEADFARVWQAARPAIDARRAMVVPYLPSPLNAYVAADLVVARSGASTLAELARLGKPALFVPYPHATADHQTRNAEAVVAQGAARLLPDAQLNEATLTAALDAMFEPVEWHALNAAAQKLSVHDAAAQIGARVRQAFHSPMRRASP